MDEEQIEEYMYYDTEKTYNKILETIALPKSAEKYKKLDLIIHAYDRFPKYLIDKNNTRYFLNDVYESYFDSLVYILSHEKIRHQVENFDGFAGRILLKASLESSTDRIDKLLSKMPELYTKILDQESPGGGGVRLAIDCLFSICEKGNFDSYVYFVNHPLVHDILDSQLEESSDVFPLYIATYHGNIELVKQLLSSDKLEKKADLYQVSNVFSLDSFTLACTKGHIELIDYLYSYQPEGKVSIIDQEIDYLSAVLVSVSYQKIANKDIVLDNLMNKMILKLEKIDDSEKTQKLIKDIETLINEPSSKEYMLKILNAFYTKNKLEKELENNVVNVDKPNKSLTDSHKKFKL